MLIWVADYLAQFESGFGVFKYWLCIDSDRFFSK